MKTVHAVFENGVFRPTEEVHLPEHCVVDFEPRPVNGESDKAKALKRIHKILSRNCDTGIRDMAAQRISTTSLVFADTVSWLALQT